MWVRNTGMAYLGPLLKVSHKAAIKVSTTADSHLKTQLGKDSLLSSCGVDSIQFPDGCQQEAALGSLPLHKAAHNMTACFIKVTKRTSLLARQKL